MANAPADKSKDPVVTSDREGSIPRSRIPDPTPPADPHLTQDAYLRVKALDAGLAWADMVSDITETQLHRSIQRFHNFLKGTP